MIRLLLRSYIKRFISIFIALVFISALSAGIFNAFLSAKEHLVNDSSRFFNEYGYVDEQISLKLDEREEYMDLYEMEGVASIDMRLTIGVHLQKMDGKIINSKVITYSDNDNELMKRYIVSEIPRREKEYNIAISDKFAQSNNFKVGDQVKLTLSSVSHVFYINAIFDTVEGIYPNFNPYIWTDDYDFGYVYFLESDLSAFIKEYAPKIATLMLFDINLRTVFQNMMSSTNLAPINLNNIGDDFASSIVNEILIKNAPGYSEDYMKEKLDEYFENKGVEPISILKGDDTPSRKYMNSVDHQLGVSFIFLPVFFYVIIAILIALFIGQIIRQTTRNIGIMLSNGVSRKEIILLLLSFSLLIAFIAVLISIPVGYGISHLVAYSMV